MECEQRNLILWKQPFASSDKNKQNEEDWMILLVGLSFKHPSSKRERRLKEVEAKQCTKYGELHTFALFAARRRINRPDHGVSPAGWGADAPTHLLNTSST